MICIDSKMDCCGCGSCVSACPVHCIHMSRDAEGFLYPVVDEGKCISCDACSRSCPILQKKPLDEKEPQAVVSANKDGQKRHKSTSGGFFRALADYVLETGGVVYGVKYDKDFLPVHTRITEMQDLDAICRSKYVQSTIGSSFENVLNDLSQSRIVLFSGTPCQIAGLKQYLKKEYDNLICCDVVCRGVISPALWRKYLQELIQKYGSSIRYIGFREKIRGFHKSKMVIAFENGRIHAPSTDVEWISRFYADGLCLRPSCYECQFKGRNRVSDFTMFDCWDVSRLVEGAVDDDRGYTSVYIHSSKGAEMLNRLKSQLDTWEIDPMKAEQYDGVMINGCVPMPKNRDAFFASAPNLCIDELGKMFSPIPLSIKGKELIKKMIRRTP